MRLRKINYLLLGLVCFFANAQEFSEEYIEYKQRFTQKPVIDLKDHQFLKLELKNNEIEITYKDFTEALYLDRRAKFDTESSLEYSSFSTLKDIEAYSFSFEKGKYRKNKVDKFSERDVTENSFYDDVKEVKFILPKLNEGAKSIISYTKEIQNPRFLPPSFFGSRNPLIEKKLEVIVDNDIEIDFLSFNMDPSKFDYSISKKSKKTIHTWEAKNIDAFEDGMGSISFKEYVPHIVPIVRSYKSNDQHTKVLGEVQDLFNWYSSLTAELNKETLTPELKNIVHDITKNATSDLDKVRAVYYWTQQNIKYIDIEYGFGGFIPREANVVFEQKYGDCKDNSSLMQAMLHELNIPSYLTWVGTRSLPYTYLELPTPMVDNHMILTYKDDVTGKYYFLDATGRYLDLGLPSSFIQGKQVLIALDNKNYELYNVPFVSPEENHILEVNRLTLKSLNLNGESVHTITGYEKINVLSKLENRKDEKKIDFYRGRFPKGSGRFTIRDIQEFNLFEYDKDLSVSFSFEIQNYLQKIGDEYYLNLNLVDKMKNYDFGRINERDIEVKHKMSYTVENRLQIPEGHQVSFFPENISQKNPFFEIEISYQLIGNELIYRHYFKFLRSRVLQNEQEELKKYIKDNRNHLKDMVVIQKQ